MNAFIMSAKRKKTLDPKDTRVRSRLVYLECILVSIVIPTSPTHKTLVQSLSPVCKYFNYLNILALFVIISIFNMFHLVMIRFHKLL